MRNKLKLILSFATVLLLASTTPNATASSDSTITEVHVYEAIPEDGKEITITGFIIAVGTEDRFHFRLETSSIRFNTWEEQVGPIQVELVLVDEQDLSDYLDKEVSILGTLIPQVGNHPDYLSRNGYPLSLEVGSITAPPIDRI